jgi:hypothetical protein
MALPTLQSVALAICVAVMLWPRVPFRFVLLAFLAASHFNLTTPGASATWTVGLGNTLRVMGLPLLLVVRSRARGLPIASRQPGFALWLGLTAYAALAVLWSRFPVAGVKMVGYLVSYGLSYVALLWAFHRRERAVRLAIRDSIVVAAFLGAVQTWILGSPFDHLEARFTSFTSPNEFAMYLPLACALILARRRISLPTIAITALAGVLIVLGGGRAALLAYLAVVVVIPLGWAAERRSPLRVGVVSGILAVAASAGILMIMLLPTMLRAVSRPEELPRFARPIGVLVGRYATSDIGTFRFREEMWRAVEDEAAAPGTVAFWRGNGTSSVGELVVNGAVQYRNYDEWTVDANRLAHNEYLRAYYEWGAVGSALFAAFLLCVIGTGLGRSMHDGGRVGSLAVTTVVIIIFYLAVENVLAAAMAPVGLGCTLAIAWLAAPRSHDTSSGVVAGRVASATR